MIDDELKTLMIVYLVSPCLGWISKVITSVTDPIQSVAYQALYRLSWIGILIVAALYIRQLHDYWHEDARRYLALGVFAVPAIVACFVLGWGFATLHMALSVVILGSLGIYGAIKHFRFRIIELRDST